METDPILPLSERADEQRLHELILNSVADGVFTVDRDWRITSFNRAAELITGVQRDEAVGHRCCDVLRADICRQACALHHTIETGQNIVDMRITILNTAGERIPVSISTALLVDEDGQFLGGVETFRDLTTVELLRQRLNDDYSWHDIITKNHEMLRILSILPDVATSESSVLIEGPSGSGKELVARAIHALSSRKDGPFIAVNCGALPDTLLESELFGYRKGAFTDAKQDKPGRFARAEGGTLFLDEVGDISPALQVKLLRVLQEKEYEPLGSQQPVSSNVRIVAATNRPLHDLVQQGGFRDDLYYRLNVVRLVLPPLSQRREDIPLLVESFIDRFNAEKGKMIESIDEEAVSLIMAYDFPGNVRELQNVIEHAFVLCRGAVLMPEHLPPEVRKNTPLTNEKPSSAIEQSEANIIREMLQRHDGSRKATAEALGMHVTTLWRKMKRYGIS